VILTQKKYLQSIGVGIEFIITKQINETENNSKFNFTSTADLAKLEGRSLVPSWTTASDVTAFEESGWEGISGSKLLLSSENGMPELIQSNLLFKIGCPKNS
jgi:hypothetical protein